MPGKTPTYYENLVKSASLRKVEIPPHIVDTKLSSHFPTAGTYAAFFAQGIFIYEGAPSSSVMNRRKKGIVCDPNPPAEKVMESIVTAAPMLKEDDDFGAALECCLKYLCDLSGGYFVVNRTTNPHFYALVREAYGIKQSPVDIGGESIIGQILDNGNILITRPYAQILLKAGWESGTQDFYSFRRTNVSCLRFLTATSARDITVLADSVGGKDSPNADKIAHYKYELPALWERAFVKDAQLSSHFSPNGLAVDMNGPELAPFRQLLSKIGYSLGFKYTQLSYRPTVGMKMQRLWAPEVMFHKDATLHQYPQSRGSHLKLTYGIDNEYVNIGARYRALLEGEE